MGGGSQRSSEEVQVTLDPPNPRLTHPSCSCSSIWSLQYPPGHVIPRRTCHPRAAVRVFVRQRMSGDNFPGGSVEFDSMGAPSLPPCMSFAFWTRMTNPSTGDPSHWSPRKRTPFPSPLSGSPLPPPSYLLFNRLTFARPITQSSFPRLFGPPAWKTPPRKQTPFPSPLSRSPFPSLPHPPFPPFTEGVPFTRPTNQSPGRGLFS